MIELLHLWFSIHILDFWSKASNGQSQTVTYWTWSSSHLHSFWVSFQAVLYISSLFASARPLLLLCKSHLFCFLCSSSLKFFLPCHFICYSPLVLSSPLPLHILQDFFLSNLLQMSPDLCCHFYFWQPFLSQSLTPLPSPLPVYPLVMSPMWFMDY